MSAPAPEVRPVTAVDVPVLREIDAEGFAGYREFAPPGWQPPSTEVPLELIAASGVIWLTVDGDGGPVGHILVVPVGFSREPEDDPALAHLMHLFVRRSAWGTGVAVALHAAALRQAAREGFERARLFCAEGQARARRFYEREGWTPTRRIADSGLGVPVVEYRRELAPARPETPAAAPL